MKKGEKLYCIPTLDRLEDFVHFSEEYGASFEYNEFFMPYILDDPQKTKDIMDMYLKTGRDVSNDTLHGAFLDICVDSADPKIFAVSDLRVRQSMDIAERMGLKAVIFHTNYIVNFRLDSYCQNWLEGNEHYWRSLLKDYQGLQVYIENMFDDKPILLSTLAKRMQDEPRFGVCLDIAHAAISGTPLDVWMNAMEPYVKHLHINDNDGIQDLHAVIGKGVINWEAFTGWCQNLAEKPSILIEVRGFNDLKASVENMERKRIFPFGF